MSKTTALVLIDMQNDFIHEEGAYARGGATSNYIAALPKMLKPVANAVQIYHGSSKSCKAKSLDKRIARLRECREKCVRIS